MISIGSVFLNGDADLEINELRQRETINHADVFVMYFLSVLKPTGWTEHFVSLANRCRATVIFLRDYTRSVLPSLGLRA